MPSILLPPLPRISTIAEDPAVSSNGGSGPTWIVAVTIVTAVIAACLCASLIFFLYKRQRFQKARRRDPYLTPKEFSRRSKLSLAEQTTEDEIRRSLIIRKSLAVRASQTESQMVSQLDMAELGRLHNEHLARHPLNDAASTAPSEKKLRDDWKEWEAGLQLQRARSGERHPLESALDMQEPPRSRDRSPNYSPLMGQQKPVSPLPPISPLSDV